MANCAKHKVYDSKSFSSLLIFKAVLKFSIDFSKFSRTL